MGVSLEKLAYLDDCAAISVHGQTVVLDVQNLLGMTVKRSEAAAFGLSESFFDNLPWSLEGVVVAYGLNGDETTVRQKELGRVRRTKVDANPRFGVIYTETYTADWILDNKTISVDNTTPDDPEISFFKS